MKTSLKLITALVAGTFLLSGCAGLGTVDTEVTAFPQWRTLPGPNTAYRFERLPSQQGTQDQQAAIESLARASLAKVGMVLDPAAARYAVQVNSTSQSVGGGYNNYGGPGVFLGGGVGSGGSSGGGIGLSFPLGGRGASSSVRHDLSIVMREVATQQVVFETRASQDGGSGDRLAALPVMMDAALQGFPQPAPGTRRVTASTSK